MGDTLISFGHQETELAEFFTETELIVYSHYTQTSVLTAMAHCVFTPAECTALEINQNTNLSPFYVQQNRGSENSKMDESPNLCFDFWAPLIC